MTTVLVIQHVEPEPLGRLAPLIADRGWELRTIDCWAGATVPTDSTGIDAIVILGGPMGVADIGDPSHPYLEQEIALLQMALAADLPVLGICLGAQLLAHAAGGRVGPNTLGDPPHPCREAGWGGIHPCGDDGFLATDSAMVLHWHGDAVLVPPPGARVLAASLACPVQAFVSASGRQWGLQFHIECTADQLQAMVAADDGWLTTAGGSGCAQRMLSDGARFMPGVDVLGRQILGRILDGWGLPG